MAAPVLPSQVEALIGSESDSICTLLKNQMRLLVLWYRIAKYLFDVDGEFSNDFRNDLCAALNDCETEEEATTEGI